MIKKNNSVEMLKEYDIPQLTVIRWDEDCIRTSTGNDPFNDGYNDPNITFGN